MIRLVNFKQIKKIIKYDIIYYIYLCAPPISPGTIIIKSYIIYIMYHVRALYKVKITIIKHNTGKIGRR